MKFKQKTNEVHPSIKSDLNFSNKEINFVNTSVYKTQSSKLETIFLKLIIPLAQALCLRRICSINNEFQDNCDTLRNKLIERRHKQ